NLLAPRRPAPDLQIMCVNPTTLRGGKTTLEPYIPALVLAFTGNALGATTPWVAFSGGYSARCETSGDASWLEIAHTAGSADKRPLLTRFQQPILGLHILDLNIALGNLVKLVRDQAASFRHAS
ncbi:MAG: hypothetical protein ACXVRQ_09285, partial [Gaiellaceae bacterium]